MLGIKMVFMFSVTTKSNGDRRNNLCAFLIMELSDTERKFCYNCRDIS